MASDTRNERDSRTVLVGIRSALPGLRPAERRIAELILDDPAGFAARSMAEICDAAGTSTTTLVRFYQRIGYTRFQDLRLDLTRESLRERLENADFPDEVRDIDRDDDLDAVIAKVARSETLSISDTAQALDTEALRRAVDLVAGSSRTDTFGVGAGSIVALDLQRKLSRIGRVALTWPDSHAAWTAAAVFTPGTVAIAISHSGETADTVEFLRLAQASGAKTIAITNHGSSALVRHADVVLLTAARETQFRSGALGSRIAQLMVADCLFIGVAQSNYDAAVDALKSTFDAVQRTRTG
ncbi:MurR/RpiR family transcriptional regulator [Agromyces atrinae]|uniref:MurR/RpiR family transcriptional regulator n=1 Tax=Agromyces atrinae TaxID=592376 RepID=UPI001F579FFF|nr:MurR/RpiR family transcriptional regulator [Agromyces atrinae]MCI2957193.1 MurR/RpiR family transcriptional regulator [Agromyces atrinae]